MPLKLRCPNSIVLFGEQVPALKSHLLPRIEQLYERPARPSTRLTQWLEPARRSVLFPWAIGIASIAYDIAQTQPPSNKAIERPSDSISPCRLGENINLSFSVLILANEDTLSLVGRSTEIAALYHDLVRKIFENAFQKMCKQTDLPNFEQILPKRIFWKNICSNGTQPGCFFLVYKTLHGLGEGRCQVIMMTHF